MTFHYAAVKGGAGVITRLVVPREATARNVGLLGVGVAVSRHPIEREEDVQVKKVRGTLCRFRRRESPSRWLEQLTAWRLCRERQSSCGQSRS